MLKQVEIFTDGSCLGNPGPGGYGALLRYKQHEKTLSAGYRLTTNNRMELMAAIVALETLTTPCDVTISTDSQYVRQGITSWIHNWKKRGWKTAEKKTGEKRRPVATAGSSYSASYLALAMGERPCRPSGERTLR